MDVRQADDGTWMIWKDGYCLKAGLTHAQAWAEVDRLSARPNWKSGACEYRNLGSFDHGRVSPYTDPRQIREAGKNLKKMWRRSPKVRHGCNTKHRHGRSQ